jgi:hypothetical protein
MKTLVVLTALALVACASAEKSSAGNGATVQAKSGDYYCWRDRLVTQADALVCNWEDNAADACRSSYNTSLPRSAVASGPAEARRCDNGQWLVKVTMR